MPSPAIDEVHSSIYIPVLLYFARLDCFGGEGSRLMIGYLGRKGEVYTESYGLSRYGHLTRT